MQSLIIRRGLNKRAAEEDGPSFEQQFGILTNAVIADKFPSLDSMKIAFQLIEKKDDNSEACGAAVYMIGRNVVFVPAFFKNDKLRTGDMMFVAQTQQFLPLADPWLAWLKNKDLSDVGEIVDPSQVDSRIGTKGTTIRDISDPIVKTACVYLKGLLHTDPNMSKTASQVSLLDTALALGKNASETLLDQLIKKPDFLNATLAFYDGDKLDAFAKQASLMAEPEKTVELILPLDKEAKTLNSQELKALYKDGFFIRKTAAAESPDVIRAKQVGNNFAKVTGPGRMKLLDMNGDTREVIVVLDSDVLGHRFDHVSGCRCYCSSDEVSEANSLLDHPSLLAVDGKSEPVSLPQDVMCLADGVRAFTSAELEAVGKPLSSLKAIPSNCLLVFPNGTASRTEADELMKTKDGKGFALVTAWGPSLTLVEADNDLIKPLVSDSSIVVPKGTRAVLPYDANEDGTRKTYATFEAREKAREASKAPVAFVTMPLMPRFLDAYCAKNYNKARIYHDGSEFTVSGDRTERSVQSSIKEAALHLVEQYDVDPAIAKVMLKEASNGATYDNPKSTVYYIRKTAAEETGWTDANIGMQQVNNIPPQVSQLPMPTILEDPMQLATAVQNAAQQGIKEVFDVTALKLIVKQNHFFDEIQDDLPLFMQTLDSLCRKLFQFYWHTDKMEEKYGMVKMKALEESLKCTLDSLSELTIFFKLRTVDGSGITGDTTGDLMSGQMM